MPYRVSSEEYKKVREEVRGIEGKEEKLLLVIN
jgi:hypothetical protein